MAEVVEEDGRPATTDVGIEPEFVESTILVELPTSGVKEFVLILLKNPLGLNLEMLPPFPPPKRRLLSVVGEILPPSEFTLVDEVGT